MNANYVQVLLNACSAYRQTKILALNVWLDISIIMVHARNAHHSVALVSMIVIVAVPMFKQEVLSPMSMVYLPFSYAIRDV